MTTSAIIIRTEAHYPGAEQAITAECIRHGADEIVWDMSDDALTIWTPDSTLVFPVDPTLVG